MTGASASAASCALPRSSSRAASAIRVPARSWLFRGRRSVRGAHSNSYLECPAARFDREQVLARELSFQALRGLELRQGVRKAALAEAHHAAGVPEDDLGSRVGRRAQRFLRACEVALGVGEATPSHQHGAGRRERPGGHRLAGPAVLLGDRQCPLAQLERARQRLPGEERHEREVRQAADLDERPRAPGRAAEGILEVLACILDAAGPQLRDAEVHEREGSVLGSHG